MGSTAFKHVFWPGLLDPKSGSCRTVANLCDGIKKSLKAACKGFANDSEYDGYWQEVMPHLHPATWTFWTSPRVPVATLTQVLKARYGQTWTMNNAVKFKMPYMPGMPVAYRADCPLCHGRDCIAHLLGECAHPAIRSLVIERHNAAARKILTAILNGSRGAWQVAADIGSKRKMGMLACEDSRVPNFLLADTDFPEGPEQRAKMRPDILLIEPISAKQPVGPAREMPRKVLIVEVGYCSDTRMVEKLNDKYEQHAQLKSLLLARGHTVSVLPIVLGNTGSVYTTNADVLRALGVNRATRERLLTSLSIHAVTSMHKIIRTRRQLEHQCIQQLRRPDPP